MNRLDFSIKIAHLYPDLLNIYGDKGNIAAIKYRCDMRGIRVDIDEIKSGYRVNQTDTDFYFIGGGQDMQQIKASIELSKNKERLIEAMETDAVFLGICGGYQLLGNYYQPFEGDRLSGIGLLDAYTIAGKKRFIGNVSTICPYMDNTSVVGFENHSGLTYLRGKTKPFLKVIKGAGNNNKDKSEGARYKNVFGTYLHGSLLPKNPKLCDYLIALALKRKYKCDIPLDELDDSTEERAHDFCLKLKR